MGLLKMPLLLVISVPAVSQIATWPVPVFCHKM